MENSDNNYSIITVDELSVFYGTNEALHDISLSIQKNKITAIIGPSGCGKSTLLRCFNRMNDLIPSAQVHGKIFYNNINLYDESVDPVSIRKQIGMVFQKPNPFPKSIYDNIAFGARINNYKGNIDELVEYSLKQAALWDEVKDKLKDNGLSLSGGQQQRLCIARVLATEPNVILLDEPASALDPLATLRIEELMQELKKDYTIIIVTHNMQQASRVSDMTAFISMDRSLSDSLAGVLVEYAPTNKLFINPDMEETENYVTGRFG
ncbi:MAG TPA: phosphate ABC transporter ATP-binding protein [Anaerolineae bacterium]|nr:phosphate ABC transporter ATP-binding protein [Anaerolineae bacterium]